MIDAKDIRLWWKFWGIVALVVAVAVGVTSIVSCDKQQRNTIIDASKVACVVIPFITDNGALDEICATIEELQPFARNLSAKRRAEAEKLYGPDGGYGATEVPSSKDH